MKRGFLWFAVAFLIAIGCSHAAPVTSDGGASTISSTHDSRHALRGPSMNNGPQIIAGGPSISGSTAVATPDQFLTGIVVWANAQKDLLALADGASVTSWLPSVTNGGAMTVGNKPTVHSSSTGLLNGKRSVKFLAASSQRIYTVSGGVTAVPMSFGAVARLDTVAASGVFLVGGSNGGLGANSISAGPARFRGGQFNYASTTSLAIDAVPHAFWVDMITGRFRFWIDGYFQPPGGTPADFPPPNGFGFAPNLNFESYGDYHAWDGVIVPSVSPDGERTHYFQWAFSVHGLATTGGDIAAIGDSRTAGTLITPGVNDPVTQLTALLGTTVPAMRSITNLGSSGKTLAAMDSDFDAWSAGAVAQQHLSPVAPFALASVWGGINDFLAAYAGGATPDPTVVGTAVYASMSSLLGKIRAYGFKSIACTEAHIGYTSYSAPTLVLLNQAIDVFNALLIAGGLADAVVRLDTILPVSSNTTYWLTDRLHQTGLGAGLVAAGLAVAARSVGGLH